MDKITLDREAFKVLASDTRLDIMKALDVRQKTVTELAKELDLNKATVFEHLEKLAAVDLIQKIEDDRKWVYWQLSWKGRRLLHPEHITLAVLLSGAGGALVTAVAALWLWLESRVVPASTDMAEVGPQIMAAPVDEAPVAEAAAADPLMLGAAIGFALLTLLLMTLAVRAHLKAAGARRQPGP